jgi:threonine/homoserine efflux transporter RhtA
MTLSTTHLEPIIAIIAGVLILLMPRILNYVVAIYLIVVGILGLNLIRY